MLNTSEKETIKRFFNDGGNVLDFSNDRFSSFSLSTIGVDIKVSNLSKGKSFENFINNNSDDIIIKFVNNLVDYFDNIYPIKEKEDYLLNIENERLYKRIKEILYIENNEKSPLFYNEEKLKELNPDYIGNLMGDLMNKSNKRPNEAIGQAKDLTEAIMKDLLEKLGIEYSDKDKFNKIFNKVRDELGLKPNKEKNSEIDSISAKTLGGLGQVAYNMSILRNQYGSGHGKGNKQDGSIVLPPRYAKLAIGSSLTTINFLIETYENRFENK